LFSEPQKGTVAAISIIFGCNMEVSLPPGLTFGIQQLGIMDNEDTATPIDRNLWIVFGWRDNGRGICFV